MRLLKIYFNLKWIASQAEVELQPTMTNIETGMSQMSTEMNLTIHDRQPGQRRVIELYYGTNLTYVRSQILAKLQAVATLFCGSGSYSIWTLLEAVALSFIDILYLPISCTRLTVLGEI